MKFEPFLCPTCGQSPRGTIETVNGVAEFVHHDDGTVEYSGYTEIWYDGQMTDKDGEGKVTLICPDAHEWKSTMMEEDS